MGRRAIGAAGAAEAEDEGAGRGSGADAAVDTMHVTTIAVHGCRRNAGI